MSEWTADDTREIGNRHALMEAKRDLDATMATMVAEPVYELYPARRVMRGAALARRYYEHLFADFIPRQRGVELIDEWVNERSLAQEYEIKIEWEGATEVHRVIGILFVKDGLVAGERLHASDATFRRMLGSLFDELPLL